MAVCIYLVCSLTTSELVRQSLVCYINELESSLYDADLDAASRLSLDVHGLELGLPQLVVALSEVRWRWGSRGRDGNRTEPCLPDDLHRCRADDGRQLPSLKLRETIRPSR